MPIATYVLQFTSVYVNSRTSVKYVNFSECEMHRHQIERRLTIHEAAGNFNDLISNKRTSVIDEIL